MESASAGHPFPLIRGGGLFLLFVGAGFLLGWLVPRHWPKFAIGGAIAGFTASGLSALLPSLGIPTFGQIAWLVGSFVLELALVFLVIRTVGLQDERRLILSILFVVGVHFVTMGGAHGPLIALLGALSMVNAVVGLRARAVPLPVLGIVDAVLKLGFGAVMLLAYPPAVFPWQ